MTTSKAELTVLLFLGAIVTASAGIAAFYSVAHSALGAAGLDDAQRTGTILFGGTMAAMLVALAIGLFWLLPTMRRQFREQDKLQSLTGVLTQRSQDLETAALTDPLTGMNNRRFFDAALEHFLVEFARINRPIGLMILDLDHFKAINDTYGHDVGDEVLKAIAACLFEFTRYHDVVARLGGEEFAIVAPNLEAAELAHLAERIRAAIQALPFGLGTVRIRVTVSIGLAVSTPSDDCAGFYKRADVNLYAAKQAGRNRVCG
ncbi:GGDEF domain-containing protein [Aurantimonas sp. HBX-1]|uniref:GGDEF domain-containing protein n=1 Tax=Aurantimonas sp. HBX-1 TaxID=2906072 RepID=UPI001F227C0E|nr:GGDEF domain-containing protein [Aurantimonas sp. HBX-1]UIJ70508.1 GGDEF domain-containing protein [Aurantimonas sp. HBX-1]